MDFHIESCQLNSENSKYQAEESMGREWTSCRGVDHCQEVWDADLPSEIMYVWVEFRACCFRRCKKNQTYLLFSRSLQSRVGDIQRVHENFTSPQPNADLAHGTMNCSLFILRI